MSRTTQIFGILFLAALGSNSASARNLEKKPALNCFIRIQSTTAAGEKKRIAFGSRLRNEKQCRALAEIHRPNFEPQLVTEKKVTFRWRGLSGYGSKAIVSATPR